MNYYNKQKKTLKELARYLRKNKGDQRMASDLKKLKEMIMNMPFFKQPLKPYNECEYTE